MNCHPFDLEFWKAAGTSGACRHALWEKAQLIIATAAASKIQSASLDGLIHFSEQLLENRITEDQPIVVWVSHGVHRKYAGEAGEQQLVGSTPKQLATAMKKLAWAGLVTEAVLLIMSRRMWSAVQQGNDFYPPSHLVDIILQVADAGAGHA